MPIPSSATPPSSADIPPDTSLTSSVVRSRISLSSSDLNLLSHHKRNPLLNNLRHSTSIKPPSPPLVRDLTYPPPASICQFYWAVAAERADLAPATQQISAITMQKAHSQNAATRSYGLQKIAPLNSRRPLFQELRHASLPTGATLAPTRQHRFRQADRDQLSRISREGPAACLTTSRASSLVEERCDAFLLALTGLPRIDQGSRGSHEAMFRAAVCRLALLHWPTGHRIQQNETALLHEKPQMPTPLPQDAGCRSHGDESARQNPRRGESTPL